MDDPKGPRVEITEIQQQLQINYPCQWTYTVIGTDAAAVQRAVLEVIDVDEVTVAHSHTSSGGRYVSFNVEVRVHSDEQRRTLYEALRTHPAVRRVL